MITELLLIANLTAYAPIIQQEVDWLALNIYHEARSEPIAGQLAVAAVTLNRVRHKKFPNSIKGVVTHNRRPGTTKCQFSWYCDGKSDKPRNARAYKTSKILAYLSIAFGVGRIEADHYHRAGLRLKWTKKLMKVATIGNHVFYRG